MITLKRLRILALVISVGLLSVAEEPCVGQTAEKSPAIQRQSQYQGNLLDSMSLDRTSDSCEGEQNSDGSENELVPAFAQQTEGIGLQIDAQDALLSGGPFSFARFLIYALRSMFEGFEQVDNGATPDRLTMTIEPQLGR